MQKKKNEINELEKTKHDDKSLKNKQQQEASRKEKEMAEKAKPRCSICGRKKFEAPKCTCGGGGGGGPSGESASSNQDSGAALDSSSSHGQSTGSVVQTTDTITAGNNSPDLSLKPELSAKPFNSVVISDLLSARIFDIDNDPGLGTLTFKLRCQPSALSLEQRSELNKFFEAILNELAKYKEKNGIKTICELVERDKDGNIMSLRIALPTPGLYIEFILQLGTQFLPVQNLEQKEKEKIVYQEGMDHFNPTPLAMKEPSPFASNKKQHKDEEQTPKKGPFSTRPKSPLDGA